ncbi:hypothetical protein IT415_03150 [bacterium]|nr:hypothetical protein [bacterium]
MESSPRLPQVRQLTQADLIDELAVVALLALDRDELNFDHYRRIHSNDLMKNKIREALLSDRTPQKVIGLEFFRQAHEAWVVAEGLVMREELADYWEVWCEWALLILGPTSEFSTTRQHPEYASAFERLPHEQQEWLDLDRGQGSRRPLNQVHMAAILKALRDLDDVLFHRSELSEDAECIDQIDDLDEVDDTRELVGVS